MPNRFRTGVPQKYIGTSESFVQEPGHILEVAGKSKFHSMNVLTTGTRKITREH